MQQWKQQQRDRPPEPERRELKEELRYCLADLARRRRLTTSKPDKVTKQQWVVWNLAPFFRHTTRSATKHRKHHAWEGLSRFLQAIADYRSTPWALQKTYERLDELDPKPYRDPWLAVYLRKHKGHRKKLSPQEEEDFTLSILSTEAFQRLTSHSP